MGGMAARKDPFFDFDPAKARGPRGGPDVGGERPAGEGGEAAGAMTVSVLVGRVKDALREAFDGRVTVVGEISNFKRHTSGHLYFRLKDAACSIDAVMFRGPAGRVAFEPADGLEVVVEGRVDVYDVRGQLQLYAQRMTPKGVGSLELAFRQLKEKLAAEGLFEASRKKPLPGFPRAVGVVTSPTGAAIRDIRRTLARRWPAVEVYLFGSLVQGPGSAEQVAEAIGLLDAAAGRLGIETIVVGRGGGSLEDLWAFNTEAVARAVAAASTPVISAVGHEVDVTICDLVADVRAATPTAAAELAVPDRREVARHVATLSQRLTRRVAESVATARAALAAIGRSVVFRDPTGRVRTQTQRLDEASHRLRAAVAGAVAAGRRRLERPVGVLAATSPVRLRERAASAVDRLAGRLVWVLGAASKRAGEAVSVLAERMAGANPRHRVELARQRVEAARRQLEAMSYRSVLRRGYSVTRGEGGRIVRGVNEVAAGETIETELADGRVRSRVEPDGPAGEPAGEKPIAKPKRKARRAPAGPGLFD